MSATQKGQLEQTVSTHHNIEKLGIIAGGGNLPERLIKACEQQNIKPFIIALEGQTDPFLVKGQEHFWARLGGAGQIFKTLRAHDIKDLVLIGSVRRPSLSELRPDLKTAEFFARVGLKALGDDNFLRVLRDVIENEGFQVHGVHKFAHDLLAKEGPLGKYKPKEADWIDIKRGLQVSQELGRVDVGQSVIVQEGIVLGVEAAEGTDELIRRCARLHRKGRSPVLIKTCKPDQDEDFDLPTVGPQTLHLMRESNMGGLILHARHSLLIDPEEVIEIANQHKIYVKGLTPSDHV